MTETDTDLPEEQGELSESQASAGADQSDADPSGADASNEVVIVLPARSRLADAEALKLKLMDHLDAETVVFDASAVEEIGTPSILTLISFVHARQDFGRPVAVLSAPPCFVDAFSDLGLFQDLMKMEFRT